MDVPETGFPSPRLLTMADLGNWPDSATLNRTLADESAGQAILSFSGGKDSIGAWIAMQEAGFDDIVPVFLYLVPGLKFVDDMLGYYEEQFGVHIVRLPHPSLHRMLNGGLLQTPGNTLVIDAAELPDHDYDDCFDVCRIDYELGDECMAAVGVRAADSPNRWSAIKQYGPVNRKRRSWYPIYDWKADDLRAAILRRTLKLPVDYRLFARSFDGLDARFVIPIKHYFPKDYQTIRDWFPLVDAIVHRYEMFFPDAARAILAAVEPGDGLPTLTVTRRAS